MKSLHTHIARRSAPAVRLQLLRNALLLLAGAAAMATQSQAQTSLADLPLFSSSIVPGNVVLPLSVEWPTVQRVAHTDAYDSNSTFLGYFDPAKCYDYHYVATETATDINHFFPTGLAAGTAGASHTCTSKWSGNFLNWATMQTVDPFRWALTGGYRVTDSATDTIIEKAWASGQGGTGNFPNRTTTSGGTIADTTPFTWGTFKMRVQGLGNKLRFSQTGNIDSAPTAYDPTVAVVGATVYEVSVRVKVCDTSASAGGVEANCTAFPGRTTRTRRRGPTRSRSSGRTAP